MVPSLDVAAAEARSPHKIIHSKRTKQRRLMRRCVCTLRGAKRYTLSLSSIQAKTSVEATDVYLPS